VTPAGRVMVNDGIVRVPHEIADAEPPAPNPNETLGASPILTPRTNNVRRVFFIVSNFIELFFRAISFYSNLPHTCATWAF
jgi:hypothetical protein